MSTGEMTLNEIRIRGHRALLRELGPVGYVRFLQQFQGGEGNYPTDRDQWLDQMKIEDVMKMVTAEEEKRAKP